VTGFLAALFSEDLRRVTIKASLKVILRQKIIETSNQSSCEVKGDCTD